MIHAYLNNVNLAHRHFETRASNRNLLWFMFGSAIHYFGSVHGSKDSRTGSGYPSPGADASCMWHAIPGSETAVGKQASKKRMKCDMGLRHAIVINGVPSLVECAFRNELPQA